MKDKQMNSPSDLRITRVPALLMIPILSLAMILLVACPDSNTDDSALEEVDLGAIEQESQQEADKAITTTNMEQMARDLLKEIQEDEAAGR